MLLKEALVFTYLYPRLDANVSTGINHLLKSPWCVHPKTGKFVLCDCCLGKICVPIDPLRPHDFYVSKVPTLTDCINELGQSKFLKEEEIAVP
jgi:DNA primase small subunit